MNFGASLDGVVALLPQRIINDTSMPSIAHVHYFLSTINSQVSLALGAMHHLEPTVRADVITEAAATVEMGAAALAEKATFPERVSADDYTSYGAQLQASYTQRLKALAVVVASGGIEPFAGPIQPNLGCAWKRPHRRLIVNEGGHYDDPRWLEAGVGAGALTEEG